MNDKERFISLLKSTQREGIEKLILWLENSSFFDDPASARFHGNFKGGLCEHSLIVYDEFVKLTKFSLFVFCRRTYRVLNICLPYII